MPIFSRFASPLSLCLSLGSAALVSLLPAVSNAQTATVTSNWTQQSPANSPPARQYGTMVYDAATGLVVLFAGFGQSGNLGDTWTYDGMSWTQQYPANSPQERANSTMAYDSATGQVMLFGGVGSNTDLNDTWTYDDTTWTLQSPTSSPSARYASATAYDTATGQVLLFGGVSRSFRAIPGPTE